MLPLFVVSYSSGSTATLYAQNVTFLHLHFVSWWLDFPIICSVNCPWNKQMYIWVYISLLTVSTWKFFINFCRTSACISTQSAKFYRFSVCLSVCDFVVLYLNEHTCHQTNMTSGMGITLPNTIPTRGITLPTQYLLGAYYPTQYLVGASYYQHNTY